MSQTLPLRLIQGEFICASTDPRGFESLRDDEARRSEVSTWLQAAGFQLNATSGGAAYFAAVRHALPKEHKADALAQFKQAYEAEALVRGMMDALRCSGEAAIEFKPGELLRGTEIFRCLDASESHRAKLRKLWGRLGKKNKDVNDFDVMVDCLDAMASWGYLALESKPLTHYRICGKIEHMFDLIEFALSRQAVAQDADTDESDDARPDSSTAPDAASAEGQPA